MTKNSFIYGQTQQSFPNGSKSTAISAFEVIKPSDFRNQQPTLIHTHIAAVWRASNKPLTSRFSTARLNIKMQAASHVGNAHCPPPHAVFRFTDIVNQFNELLFYRVTYVLDILEVKFSRRFFKVSFVNALFGSHFSLPCSSSLEWWLGFSHVWCYISWALQCWSVHKHPVSINRVINDFRVYNFCRIPYTSFQLPDPAKEPRWECR